MPVDHNLLYQHKIMLAWQARDFVELAEQGSGVSAQDHTVLNYCLSGKLSKLEDEHDLCCTERVNRAKILFDILHEQKGHWDCNSLHAVPL